MKTNYTIATIIFMLGFLSPPLQGQSKDYRQDSLQFKMYTRLYVNDQLGVDSIRLKKIFCDYCSQSQMEVLENEAIRQSKLERYNPKYKKTGRAQTRINRKI